MIRNLKAIKELRQGQVPAIAIGRADQVTVTNRPSRRRRPVKTELPQALSDRAVRITERSSDIIETPPDTTRDAIASAPAPQTGADQVAAGGDTPSDVGANVSGRLCGLRDASAHAHATEGRHRLAGGTSELTTKITFTRAITGGGSRHDS
jgi:hypothetical protein